MREAEENQNLIMHFLCGSMTLTFISFFCFCFGFYLPYFFCCRLSGLENGLLGLSSRINAVMWSRSVTEIENVDIICFGHLLYEMCTGQELTTPKPSMRVLEMELQHYPQIGQVREGHNHYHISLLKYSLCRFWKY